MKEDNELLETIPPADRPGGYWGEMPSYPVGDWAYEVANGDTRLGYWEWVANQTKWIK